MPTFTRQDALQKTPLTLALAALLLSGCLGGEPGDSDVGPDVQLSSEPVTFQILSLAEWGGRLDPVEVDVCRADATALRAGWDGQGCAADLEAVAAGVEACALWLGCADEPDADGLLACAIHGLEPACTVRLSAGDVAAIGGEVEVEVGGAATLAGWWGADRARLPGATLILSTGDAFGASPPLASFFEEAPVVEALDAMGLDVDTLGNHNFDRGLEHLQRMIDLADFEVIVANLTRVPQNVRGVAPFTIEDLGGVPVALIGLTDPEAPSTVFPGSFGTMSVSEPLSALLEARALAAASGARVFVVVAHLGVEPYDDGGALMPQARTISPQGPLISLWREAQRASGGGFDLFIGRGALRSMTCALSRSDLEAAPRCTDHSAEPSAVDLAPDDLVLVQGRGYGESYTRVRMTAVPATGEILEQRVEHELPETCGASERAACDEAAVAAVVALLEPYRVELAVTSDEVIGSTDGELVYAEQGVRGRSVAIGNLVTDAIRARADADVAVFNGGGLRDGLPSSYMVRDPDLHRSGAPPLALVRGDIDAVLPFSPSTVVTLGLSADALYQVLERSVAVRGTGGFLQVAGLSFVYAPDAPEGERVCSIELAAQGDGEAPVRLVRGDTQTTLQLATIDFLAQGGDGYLVLSDKAHITRGSLQEMVIAHIESLGQLSLSALSAPRIVQLDAGQTCADEDASP